MVVPKSEKNNLDVVAIAETYYKVCCKFNFMYKIQRHLLIKPL